MLSELAVYLNDNILKDSAEVESLLEFHPGGDSKIKPQMLASCKDLGTALAKAGLQPNGVLTGIWLHWLCCACVLRSSKSLIFCILQGRLHRPVEMWTCFMAACRQALRVC